MATVILYMFYSLFSMVHIVSAVTQRLVIAVTVQVLLPFLARLHEVHRAIVVTSVVRVYLYVYVYVRVTLSVKVFYKSIFLDHVDGSS